jgi:hypothetical protein
LQGGSLVWILERCAKAHARGHAHGAYHVTTTQTAALDCIASSFHGARSKFPNEAMISMHSDSPTEESLRLLLGVIADDFQLLDDFQFVKAPKRRISWALLFRCRLAAPCEKDVAGPYSTNRCQHE